MRPWATAAASTLAALALLAGCGSGSSGVTSGGTSGAGGAVSAGHDSQTVKGKAYIEAMMSDFKSTDQTLTETQARCMAGTMVDVVGVSTLEKAGVTPADVTNNTLVFGTFKPSDQQAEAILDGIFSCVDFGKVFADQIVGASGNSVPSDKLSCVGTAMTTNSQFRTYMKQTLMGLDTQSTIPSDGLIPMMLDIFQKCGVDPAALGS
jgi:hypothetical protein